MHPLISEYQCSFKNHDPWIVVAYLAPVAAATVVFLNYLLVKEVSIMACLLEFLILWRKAGICSGSCLWRASDISYRLLAFVKAYPQYGKSLSKPSSSSMIMGRSYPVVRYTTLRPVAYTASWVYSTVSFGYRYTLSRQTIWFKPLHYWYSSDVTFQEEHNILTHYSHQT